MPYIGDAQISFEQFNDLSADPDAPLSGRIRLFFKDALPFFRKASGAVVPLLSPLLDYIHLADEKSQGLPGGTFTSGAWRTRDLNQKKSDAGGHCSLSNNQFTLAAGTYRARIQAPAFAVGTHMARLQNVTDDVTVLTGQSEYNAVTAESATICTIIGRFAIAAPKTFEVQHICYQTVADVGLGVGGGYAVETFTVVELLKE
jgi:hypothetical protein